MEWINQHSSEDYAELPILVGIRTKAEALERLRQLLEKGQEWIPQ
jgi:hypothetical protein